MQNKVINYTIVDNTSDQNYLINPTKQQIFSLPKEESQMFTSKTYNFTGTRPGGYTNDPLTETVDRDNQIGTTNVNSSFGETDYIGLSTFSIPYNIAEGFFDYRLVDTIQNRNVLLNTGNSNLTRISNGVQLIKFPKDILNTVLTDPNDIINNGNNPIRKNIGVYYLTITPKFFKVPVVSIDARGQYDIPNMADNIDSSLPVNKRRRIFHCNNTNALGTVWNFEQNQKQSGRLLGSVVEVWDSAETVLKQTKIMNENIFNFNLGTDMQVVLSPDNVGYDSPVYDVSIGDILKIYPRETSFDQITIALSYEDQANQVASALAFLLNDVARDMTTGVYDIYDNGGISVDSSGNINGTVIQSYQIQQFNNLEIRKRING